MNDFTLVSAGEGDLSPTSPLVFLLYLTDKAQVYHTCFNSSVVKSDRFVYFRWTCLYAVRVDANNWLDVFNRYNTIPSLGEQEGLTDDFDIDDTNSNITHLGKLVKWL